jgi:hypothetical protein
MAKRMEHAQMNLQQLEGTTEAFVANGRGLLKMDGSNGPPIPQSFTPAKKPDSIRKIARSLSQFLKTQRSSLALRRQDDRKQAQP